jgi:iron(III) transport system ATP-binding protein
MALLRATGTTSVIVTHDPEEALRIADRIALLDAGRLIQMGAPKDLYARPATLEAARLFGPVNELRGVCRRGVVETPLGRFAAPHVPDAQPVSVCIRPQHIRPSSSGVPARVVATHFLGDAEQLVLEVTGADAPVTVRTAPGGSLAPGDAVYLDVCADAVCVLARG